MSSQDTHKYDDIIKTNSSKFLSLVAKLDALSPLKVLGRGYSIAMDMENNVIKSADDVVIGDKVKLRLEKDTILCSVEEK